MSQPYVERWKDASCRMALAAMLHDLGKLTERAGAHDRKSDAWAAHQTLYCPFRREGGYHTHLHAAATALAFDLIERHLPPVRTGDVAPFVSRNGEGDVTDSLVNAAAMHHKPQTFLQWCVAVGDRVASGFERERFEDYNGNPDDPQTARLLVAFESYGQAAACKPEQLAWRYPLAPLSPAALFPVRASEGPTRLGTYEDLWQHFQAALSDIPRQLRASWPLWLDAFDSACLSAFHSVPSATAFGVRPEVSLYDHSRAAAAFAVAFWRYHAELGHDLDAVASKQQARADWDEAKFLLIQGDFTGIQDFIFGGAASTAKRAAKLLRGRSAFVSLLCELAALRVLEDLALPPTAQVIQAAGKFLIVAPNTPDVQRRLDALQRELDAWFLKRSFGLASVVVARQETSANDFIGGRFGELRRRLAGTLDRAKLQRFDLAGASAPDPILAADYTQGACPYDTRLPADTSLDGVPCSRFSADQIRLGGWLASAERPVLIVERADAAEAGAGQVLETPIFGFRVRLGDGARIPPSAVRAYDLALPGKDKHAPLFRGLALRAINARVPVLDHDPAADARYQGIEDAGARGDLKTFEHIARDALDVDEEGRLKGVAALGVLKGDLDNLGRIFATSRTVQSSFAGWAAMSRRISAFFTVALPHLCAREPRYSDLYTVFAGGDDFVLIGPWKHMRGFAVKLRQEFRHYVAENGAFHFSASYLMAKPGHPLRAIVDRLEAGLDGAKRRAGKNAIAIHEGEVDIMSWDAFLDIQKQVDALGRVVDEHGLTSGFLYDLVEISRMAGRADRNVADNGWRARLHYRVRRHIADQRKLKEQAAERAQAALLDGLVRSGLSVLKGQYRHVLTHHLYSVRDQRTRD